MIFVKRTEALELAARAFKGEVFADHVNDIDGTGDLPENVGTGCHARDYTATSAASEITAAATQNGSFIMSYVQMLVELIMSFALVVAIIRMAQLEEESALIWGSRPCSPAFSAACCPSPISAC